MVGGRGGGFHLPGRKQDIPVTNNVNPGIASAALEMSIQAHSAKMCLYVEIAPLLGIGSLIFLFFDTNSPAGKRSYRRKEGRNDI